MQPPTPGHPASKRSTRTFWRLCPGLTTSSSPNSLTALQDQNELPGNALGAHSALVLSVHRPVSGHPSQDALLFFPGSFTHRPQPW